MINLSGYSILASMATTFILGFVFLTLYKQGHDKHMMLWGLTWLVYSAMFLTDLCRLAFILDGNTYIIFRQIAAVIGSYIFLQATLDFFKLPSYFHFKIVTAVSILSIVFYGFATTLMNYLVVPNIIICSSMIIISGGLFVTQSWTANAPRKTFAAFIIFLWSIFINHFSYSFTTQIVAVYSCYIGLVVVNLLIVTLMIIYFKKQRFLDNQMFMRYRLLVENSDNTVFLYDYSDGEFEYVSPSITPVLGVSAEHLYHDPKVFFSHLQLEDGNEDILNIFNNRISKLGQGSFRLVTADGNDRWIDMHFIPIRDNTGTVSAIEGILKDVTDEKLAEFKIIAAEKAKEEFYQDISHEIKTPLTIITGYTETLITGVLPKESVDTYIKMIHSKALILNNLLDDLSTPSDFTSQTLKYKFYEANAQEVFASIMEEASVQITEAGRKVAIHLDINPDIVIIVDRNRLEQVVTNLINNAIRHTPAGQTISLSCANYVNEELIHIPDDATSDEIPRGDVIFSVSDSGSGIPEEDLPHIFERNFSGRNRIMTDDEKSSDKPVRTGLGLYISRQILSQHSGLIYARNNVGNGATFEFKLPYYF